MQTILVAVHLLLSIGLIGLVLVQHGKGADAGAAFGSGSSSTVFGAQGSGTFLSRTTGVLATLFFITSMALAYYAIQGTEQPDLMQAVTPQAAQEVPAPLSEIPVTPEVLDGAGSEIPVIPTGE